jgi:hypothetical protein
MYTLVPLETIADIGYPVYVLWTIADIGYLVYAFMPFVFFCSQRLIVWNGFMPHRSTQLVFYIWVFIHQLKAVPDAGHKKPFILWIMMEFFTINV